VRNDTGGASQIFFIVRNDASHSDILFQTSDETWHAYNPYGGHSLYGDTGFNLQNRAYKVSYNRPFNTANLETATWIFNGEYPMVRWLEANGYDVSYFTSVDAARTGSLIANHKIYLSVGHDEYWSGPKRASVEAARAAGVNLAFFSGNEGFWKTRWENSVDGSNTPYRTLVCYKETLGPNSTPSATAAVDPQDPPNWTGTWRDASKSPPADGGRPENALNGTLFEVNGPGADNTNLSIKVPAADGKMRFWRKTAVAAQSANQTWTLPAGTLGYEWDIDADNGFRPAGLFDMSTASYNLTSDYLLDAGGLYGAGTAVHHLTLYRYYKNVGQPTQAPLGLVFGAGTVQWSWGLDANHDNSGTPTDPNMQQATVNLFADMGAQPATLQSGLLLATQSTDTIAPVSQVTAPANGSQVRVNTTINITGTAVDIGGGVVGGVELSLDAGNTWHPASGRESWTYAWTPSATGNYTILTRATDDSGNLEIPSAGITVAATTTAQTLTSLKLNASIVSGGNTVQGTVTLGQPATSGGIAVTLSSTNPSVASVPSAVTVPAGQFTANFPVTTFGVTVPTSVTISGMYVATNSASLTVTSALPPPPGNVAVDAFLSKDQATASTAITSGIFSTSLGNELVLALVATDASASHITATSVTGGGLTWALVQRTNTQMGTSEIWRAFAASTLTNASVTANLSQSVVSSMQVMSFAGVDTSGTNGSGAIGATGSGNASTGSPTASLTTLSNNSLVLGVGNDWDNAIARVVGSNQTLLHQYLSSSGDTYWMQMWNAPIATAGTSVTINDTTPTTDRYNLSIVEVRPASGTLTISGTITPPATGSGATLTLSGAASSTTTANTSGAYSFQGLLNGTYTVTPSKPGVVFTPTSGSVTLTGSGMTINFNAATLQLITVTPANTSIQAGSTQPFTATGTYSNGNTQNITTQVTWSSSNTNVATISSSGVASAVAGGSATIAATQGAVSGNTTLTVQATAVGISTSTLPNAVQNQPYSASLNATGGTPPYSWALSNNTALPQGLTLSPTGQITGTPTVVGTITFTIQVSDSSTPQQTATQQLTIVVASAPTSFTIWSPTSVPGTVDVGGANCSSCTLVQATNSGGFGVPSDPTTYVQPTTGGNLLIVFGAHSGWTGSGTTTISDSAGNVWHPCNGTGTGPFTDVRVNGIYGMSCHYAVNIIGAAGDTVTISASDCTASCSFVGGSYLEYSGVASTAVAAWDAYGVNASAASTTGSNNTTCGSVTPTQNNDLVICGLDQANGNATVGTSPVNFGSLDQPGTNVAVEHVVWPSVATINPTMGDSVSSDPYAGITLALRGGSGAGSAAELGMKFKSDVNGTITGVRFYKSSNNTGTHIGNLWSSSGTLLATATFTNETASGWQQVTFSPAVPITANTIYVASYHTNVGHYSDDQNYFASSGVDNPPLHALQNGVSGANGVFALGSSSSFPSTGSNSSNYWVDVVFVPSATLTSIAVTPTNPTIQAGSTTPFTATGTYSDSSTQNITTQVSWSSSKTSVATINSSGVASAVAGGNSTITATQGSINGSTTLTVQPAGLVITTTTLANAVQNQVYSATLAASGGTPPYTWSLANNTTLPPGLTLSGNQITGTPTGTGTTTFTVQATDSGTAPQIATQSLSLTVNASGCPCSIAGNISGSGGKTATVTLSGAASLTVTADSSGNYIFNGLANGIYTVTPSNGGFAFSPTSQGITLAGASKTGVNFSSTAQLAIDQNVSTDRSSNATTIASPTFSTTKTNELLLAFVATDATAANITVTGVTGAALTWTLVKRTNTQRGTAEIWRAFSSTSLSSVSVTATLSQSVAASITVVTFTGADSSGTGGSGAIGNTGTGNANPGAPTAQLTTTRNNSWVFGVGNDYDNAIAHAPGSNQTMVHQYLATIGDTYWVQRQNTTTSTSGTVVTINDTAPTGDSYNLAICEVVAMP
jgi:hypothetical protein